MLPPDLLSNLQKGFLTLADTVDIGSQRVLVVEDNTIQTAVMTVPMAGRPVLLVNGPYESSVIGFEGENYLGLHEGTHIDWRMDNPAFASRVIWQRDGADGPGLYFHGPHAESVNGDRPVAVTASGHLRGADQANAVMADASHDPVGPQVLDGVERAMFADMNVHVWAAGEREIANIYHVTFRRDADPAGLAYWAERAREGMSLADIAQSFFSQLEAQRAFAGGHIVEAVYRNAFGRDPDAASLDYWNKALSSGAVHEGQIVRAIIDGASTADALKIVGITVEIVQAGF